MVSFEPAVDDDVEVHGTHLAAFLLMPPNAYTDVGAVMPYAVVAVRNVEAMICLGDQLLFVRFRATSACGMLASRVAIPRPNASSSMVVNFVIA